MMEHATRKIAFVQALRKRLYVALHRSSGSSNFACHVFKLRSASEATHAAAVLGMVARDSARRSKPDLARTASLSVSMDSLHVGPSRTATLPGLSAARRLRGSMDNLDTRTATLGSQTMRRPSNPTLPRRGYRLARSGNNDSGLGLDLVEERRRSHGSANSLASSETDDMGEGDAAPAADADFHIYSSCVSVDPNAPAPPPRRSSPTTPALAAMGGSLASLAESSASDDSTFEPDESFYDMATRTVDDGERTYEEAAPWFAGDISRTQAEALLAGKPAGAYLVRVSQTKLGYSLSLVAQTGATRHFMIQGAEGEHHVHGHQRTFGSLGLLLRHYSKHPITKEGDRLGEPAHRS